ncbi:hypothetical protein BY996DRAFT_8032403 [Phakopsora pachyrhizi]|nr:hypothetical protein BY996DRAFT_8032403 [Phakopsora pachyrhizi]
MCCEILEMDFFYGMHTLCKINREEFILAKLFISGLNVQHHCAAAKCFIRRTLPRRLERQETDIMLKEVHHSKNFNLYEINTATLRAQDEHHLTSSKGKNKAPESMTSIDPSLA